jgi:hypothetical protein
MDNRDIDDVMMQARENVGSVFEDIKKEQSEVELKRALGKLWITLPPEVKDEMKKKLPDIVREMNKTYGKPQGNPWGTFKPEGR